VARSKDAKIMFHCFLEIFLNIIFERTLILVIVVLQCMNKANVVYSRVHKHRNPGAVAVHVVRKEGLRGLYRGFVSNASRNTPGEMVFFATYEQSRHLIKQSGQVKDDIGMSFS